MNEFGFKFNMYGVRVPAVVVSPLLGSYVDDTAYDHTSVLKTIEYLFGLPHLTDRDASANPIANVMTATASSSSSSSKAQTSYPTKLALPAQLPQKAALTADERAALEQQPVPDRGSLTGFLGTLLKADSELSATPEERQAAVARYKNIKTRGDARAYIHEVMAKVQAKRGS